MRKNWIRFLIFSGLTILGFCWINQAMEIPSQNWQDFYRLPNKSMDVVFIGNSHGLNAFQPNIINDLLPVSSYMVGVPGENVFISYYELREILKTQQPKMIVLETFTLHLVEPVGTALIFPFTDAGVWDLNKLAVMRRFLSFDLAYTSFPSLRTRIDWNHPSDFLSKMAGVIEVNNERETSRFFGASPDPEPLSEAEFSEILKMPVVSSTNSPVENRKSLDKIVELCEQNNIQLLLVSAPVIKIAGQFFTYYTSFDVAAYAKEKGVDVITFDASSFNKLHYANADHLSVFGSHNVTVDLAREIAKRMDLQIDEKRSDYYESFRFSEFSMECQAKTCTLTLSPEDPSADLLYQFVLMDEDYQALYSTDYQEESCFIFENSEGKIHILVHILAPQGDYEIKAYFNNY